MKFPYRRYAIEPSPAAPMLSIISRPVIPVRFSGSKGTRNCYALLDTGADESYITQSMAEKLGIAPLSEVISTVQSASGKMSIMYGEVLIEVADGDERFSRRIAVGIADETWSEAILGHIGFLEHFDATFSYVDQTVTLLVRGE
ncbi:MAG TPA: retropepsin-like aspartic protease [Pirellulales bacterium]|nr:retropepsin-like aspartic protease [Pirellulales bacterium]